ncbi:MAG: SpoIID/LytB domain-containing protein [Clostridiales bacterium]|jgi:stage II sporulation protein D|nr:SpoIID/LytB domain-containing protein [Clostridiales bacterium]
MKKFFIKAACVLLVLAVCLSLSYTPHFASAYPPVVRVGLLAYQNAAEISFGAAPVQAGFGTNGSFIPSALLNISGAFSVAPANSYYLRVGGFFNDYESARRQAENYANSGGAFGKACAGLMDDNLFAVYIGGYASSAEAEAAKFSFAEGCEILNPAPFRSAIFSGANPVMLFDNETKNAQIKADGNITLGKRSYRGVMEFVCRKTGISAVNVIPIEEYLYSVVASEMPSGWNGEALKAQAVASRSYCASRLNSHEASGYNFCDGTHCQLYLGTSAETETAVRAVEATAGIMAYYNNEPINAVYFASSGGATADSEKVWYDKVPYLRAVPDYNETTAKQWQRKFSLSEITLMLSAKGYNAGQALNVTASELSAYGRVDKLDIKGTNETISLKGEEIRTFFSPSQGGSLESRMFSIGDNFISMIPENQKPASAATVSDLASLGNAAASTAEGTQSSSSGSNNGTQNTPAKVYLQGAYEGGEFTLEGLKIFSGGGLPSLSLSAEVSVQGAQIAAILSGAQKVPASGALADTSGLATSTGLTSSTGDVTLKNETDLANESPQLTTPRSGGSSGGSDTVIFTGRGNGHGVGMSQHGANAMAAAGYTYKEILAHYYTGVEVR